MELSREPPDVTELAEHNQPGQLAHPVKAHQCSPAGLAARQLAQLTLKRRQLCLDRLDYRERHLDPLQHDRGQRVTVGEVPVGAQLDLAAAIGVRTRERLTGTLRSASVTSPPSWP